MYSLGRILIVAQTGMSKGMEGMQRAILSMAPENILIFRFDVDTKYRYEGIEDTSGFSGNPYGSREELR